MSASDPESLHSESIELMHDLLRLPGLPGYEGPVRQRLQAAWDPLLEELQVSALGNLIGYKRSGRPGAPTLLLTAHMDAIGLMVSEIQGPFLRLAGLGSPDARTLAGQRVTVLADEPLPGYVMGRPRSVLPDDGDLELDHLLLDVGLEPDEIEARVQIGDPVAPEQEYQGLAGERFFARALDNRLSLVALAEALRQLADERLQVDLLVAATSQEETHHGGGVTLGSEHQPEAAVILDVTFGRAPGAPQHQTFPLGAGITIGRGPSLHPQLGRWIEATADEADLAWAPEVLPRRSGTDADWIQLTGRGVACGLISIPILNMHTCVEVGDLRDVRACADLLAALGRAASAERLESLSWD